MMPAEVFITYAKDIKSMSNDGQPLVDIHTFN